MVTRTNIQSVMSRQHKLFPITIPTAHSNNVIRFESVEVGNRTAHTFAMVKVDGALFGVAMMLDDVEFMMS